MTQEIQEEVGGKNLRLAALIPVGMKCDMFARLGV